MKVERKKRNEHSSKQKRWQQMKRNMAKEKKNGM